MRIAPHQAPASNHSLLPQLDPHHSDPSLWGEDTSRGRGTEVVHVCAVEGVKMLREARMRRSWERAGGDKKRVRERMKRMKLGGKGG